MSELDNYSVLRIRAFNDLTNRAKPGISIYLIIWFAIAFGFGIHEKAEGFFLVNSALIVFFFLTRFTHFFLRNKVTKDNVGFFESWLIGSILFGAVHWGLMSAYVFYEYTQASFEAPLLIVLSAFSMGGTSTLAISRAIRSLYPCFLIAPSIMLFLYRGADEDYLWGGMLIASWIYIHFASGSAQSDYWQAISNSLIAEGRAKDLEKLSITDPLTQLKNRMYFDDEYEKEWQRGARLKTCLSVLMIDLDFFKSLNDDYGHAFGDEVLQKVSRYLENSVLRPTDCVARYGGEEFIFLLPNTDEDGLSIVAERIVKGVSKLKFESNGDPVKVTCSVGGATTFPHPSHDPAVLVKRADEALYRAKDNGRNQFIIDSEPADPSIPKISG